MKLKTPLLLIGATAVAAAAYKAYDFFKHNEVTVTIEVDEKDDVLDADTCSCNGHEDDTCGCEGHHDHDEECDCEHGECDCEKDEETDSLDA